MDETSTNPQQPSPGASTDPAWGPPNPNYPPAGQNPPPGYAQPGYGQQGYGQQGYTQQGQYPPSGYAAPARLSTNTAAAVAYLTFIPAVIFLAVEPYSRDSFIRFHAWQCILLTLVDIAGDIVFGYMGLTGQMVRGLLGLLLFVFWLIAIIKASKGERFHVPILGDLAESIAAKV